MSTHTCKDIRTAPHIHAYTQPHTQGKALIAGERKSRFFVGESLERVRIGSGRVKQSLIYILIIYLLSFYGIILFSVK